MNPPVSKNPLVVQIAAGNANDELLQFLLTRQLAFTEEEYLEALVFVLPNLRFHDQALTVLRQIPLPVMEKYVQKREAHLQVVDFIINEALRAGHANILALISQSQFFTNEFLLRIAARGKANALEALLENQIRLIAYPEIMEQMELNPQCSPFIRNRIKELRDFYLQPQAAAAIPEAEVMDDLTAVMAQEQKDDSSPIQIQQVALTALQRINRMSVSERIHLALTGNKTERLVLIKDSNKLVQQAVIESPKMSDDEVLIHIRNLSLPGELIGQIANNRDWTKNYTIILALVQNPKTPISRAVGFIKQLHMRDLKLMIQDRNINPVIRNMALNLQRQKERVK